MTGTPRVTPKEAREETPVRPAKVTVMYLAYTKDGEECELEETYNGFPTDQQVAEASTALRNFVAEMEIEQSA